MTGKIQCSSAHHYGGARGCSGTAGNGVAGGKRGKVTAAEPMLAEGSVFKAFLCNKQWLAF